MNYPRVDFLNKSERRYQGAVSRRFLVAGAVIAPVLLIAGLSAIKVAQYASVKSDLEVQRELWSKLEPRLKSFREENAALAKNDAALKLCDAWDESQGSFLKLLNDIQGAVPANIQFTRLSVRSKAKATSLEKPEDMELNYSLQIEGVVHGDRAENHVIALRRDLLSCEQIGATFDSMKLASLRKRAMADGEEVSDFRLVGETREEKQ